jgi:hypothetical protein
LKYVTKKATVKKDYQNLNDSGGDEPEEDMVDLVSGKEDMFD